MDKINCFFCNSQADYFKDGTLDTIHSCDYCGNYSVSRSFFDDYRDDKEFRDKVNQTKYIIAGYLEETKGERNETFLISSSNYNNIIENIVIPKTSMQKLEQMLLYCYKKNEFIGQEFALFKLYKIIFNITKEDLNFLFGDINRTGVAYTKNSKELIGLFKAMDELRWINLDYTSSGEYMLYFSLSTEGL